MYSFSAKLLENVSTINYAIKDNSINSNNSNSYSNNY